jgi:predicted RNase H-like HicB family nuclease
MSAKRKSYKLTAILYKPSDSTEPDKYMAEVPVLPGCRAWGDTPEETLDTLQGVAEAFIDSYVEHGDELPFKRKCELLSSEVTSPVGSSKHMVAV